MLTEAAIVRRNTKTLNDIKKEQENLADQDLNDDQKKMKQDLHKIIHKRVPSNLQDKHLLVICNVMNIQLPEETHLLQIITEFLNYKETFAPPIKKWDFRKTSEGKFYWYNKMKGIVKDDFPYMKELTKLI